MRDPPAGDPLLLPDPETTMRAGGQLAAALGAAGREGWRGPALVHLRGPLGSGKTTLVRGTLRALGHSGPVRSPTYTLVEPYTVGAVEIYHCDLYRLAAAEELDHLGIRDCFRDGAWCLIEWPERGRGRLPPADLELEFGFHPEGRLLRVRGVSREGRRALAAWPRLSPPAT